MFTEKDVGMVTKLCMHIVSRGPVSEMRINEELSKLSAGRSHVGQIHSASIEKRIKYERRKMLIKV